MSHGVPPYPLFFLNFNKQTDMETGLAVQRPALAPQAVIEGSRAEGPKDR